MSKETKQIAIESLLEQINDQFDYIACDYRLPSLDTVFHQYLSIYSLSLSRFPTEGTCTADEF